MTHPGTTHARRPAQDHPHPVAASTDSGITAGQTTHATTHATHAPSPPTLTPLYEVGGERWQTVTPINSQTAHSLPTLR